jgi:hypothetical protein
MTLKAIFPDGLAGHRPGHGRLNGELGALPAVSGRNILILPLDASLLLALPAVG